jgi:hypothetical protein
MEVVDTLGDTATLRHQIQQYSHPAVAALVWGHGAGMIHLLWVPTGCRLVEILPCKKVFDRLDANGAAQGALRLARCRGLLLERVVVGTKHWGGDGGDKTPADPARVTDALEVALSGMQQQCADRDCIDAKGGWRSDIWTGSNGHCYTDSDNGRAYCRYTD